MFPQEKSPNPLAVVSMFSSFVCLLRGYTGAPSKAILLYEIGRRFVSVFRLNQDKVVHVAPRSYLYQPQLMPSFMNEGPVRPVLFSLLIAAARWDKFADELIHPSLLYHSLKDI